MTQPRAARAQALREYEAGRPAEASRLQIALVNRLAEAGGAPTSDYQLLALFLTHAGCHAEAAAALEFAQAREPGNPQLLENLGICLGKSGRPAEARRVLEAALGLAPDSANAHDALAALCGELGDGVAMRAHGERALLLKDAAPAGEPPHPLPAGPPPPFRHGAPQRNLIAFSLWGEQPRYLQGALQSAALAPALYPGWRCRFYCDLAAAAEVGTELERLGAEVVRRELPPRAWDALFWRFEVAGDPGAERYLVRDCDAVLNTQERVAVDAWLASGRYFHVMRDAATHTELMLAGLWGGVGGALPPLGELRTRFRWPHVVTRQIDQHFLRAMVWPTVRQSCLSHDRCFRVLGSEEFPLLGRLPPGRHVGENMHAEREAAQRLSASSHTRCS